jgi:hypothetical protein
MQLLDESTAIRPLSLHLLPLLLLTHTSALVTDSAILLIQLLLIHVQQGDPLRRF